MITTSNIAAIVAMPDFEIEKLIGVLFLAKSVTLFGQTIYIIVLLRPNIVLSRNWATLLI